MPWPSMGWSSPPNAGRLWRAGCALGKKKMNNAPDETSGVARRPHLPWRMIDRQISGVDHHVRD